MKKSIPELLAAQEEWYKINAPLGRALGYPECCINAFCAQPPELIQQTGTDQEDRDRFQASFINGNYSGFIPCTAHAKMILAGKITLASLITGRDASYPPFPELSPIDIKL